jgi:light-regulated signal transduction histidine kinase (bacteriophytochrome)
VDVEELPVASALLRGRSTANVAMTAELEDGARVWLSVNAQPLFRSGDADPYGAMVTLTDITRYKETELQLSRSNTDLAQFAVVISHDLGAPLTVIQGMADIVARRAGDTLDDQTRHLLERISAAATGGRTLIRELLDYARSGSAELNLRRVDMHELADEVVELLSPAVQEHRAAVRIGRLPTVLGDATMLRQVLQNLIGNALKFGPPADALVEVSAERTEDAWCFSVQDNGVGIEATDLDRIFVMMQRGNRTAEGYPGSGIGLAVCQRIVERHGGRIWAESEPGRGTTLRFTLPY